MVCVMYVHIFGGEEGINWQQSSHTYVVDLIMESHVYSLHNTRIHPPLLACSQVFVCGWLILV